MYMCEQRTYWIIYSNSISLLPQACPRDENFFFPRARAQLSGNLLTPHSDGQIDRFGPRCDIDQRPHLINTVLGT